MIDPIYFRALALPYVSVGRVASDSPRNKKRLVFSGDRFIKPEKLSELHISKAHREVIIQDSLLKLTEKMLSQLKKNRVVNLGPTTTSIDERKISGKIVAGKIRMNRKNYIVEKQTDDWSGTVTLSAVHYDKQKTLSWERDGATLAKKQEPAIIDMTLIMSPKDYESDEDYSQNSDPAYFIYRNVKTGEDYKVSEEDYKVSELDEMGIAIISNLKKFFRELEEKGLFKKPERLILPLKI